jgi:hypothetical protein
MSFWRGASYTYFHADWWKEWMHVSCLVVKSFLFLGLSVLGLRVLGFFFCFVFLMYTFCVRKGALRLFIKFITYKKNIRAFFWWHQKLFSMQTLCLDDVLISLYSRSLLDFLTPDKLNLDFCSSHLFAFAFVSVLSLVLLSWRPLFLVVSFLWIIYQKKREIP